MAGQKWKYDAIVALWHMENPLDAIGGHTLTISGAINIAAKLENGYDGDGLNDYLRNDALATTLASTTKGTVFGWVRVNSDQGASKTIISISDSSSATASEINIVAGMGANNGISVLGITGGTVGFQTDTELNSITVGTWHSIVINHDGTQISNIWIDGVDQTLTRTTSTDETIWFADVITAGADTGTLLALNRNEVFLSPLDATLDEFGITSNVLWDTDDVADFDNGGAGQIITDPSDRQKFIGKRPELIADRQIIGNRGNPIIR